MYRDQDGLPPWREEGDTGATPPRRRPVRPDSERNSGRGYRQSSESRQRSHHRVVDSYQRPAASSRDDQARPRDSRAPFPERPRVEEDREDWYDRNDRDDHYDRRERSARRYPRSGSSSEQDWDDSREQPSRRAAPGRLGRQEDEEDRYDRRPSPRHGGRLWDDEEDQEWRDQSTWQPAMATSGRNGAAPSRQPYRYGRSPQDRSGAGRGNGARPTPRRGIRGRWQRSRMRAWIGKQWQTPGGRVLVVALASVIILTAVSTGVYSIAKMVSITTEAVSGIHDLEALQSQFGHMSNPGEILNPTNMQELTSELSDAQQNFAALRGNLHLPVKIGSHAPVMGDSVSSLGLLLDAADEACTGGLDVLASAKIFRASLSSGLFAPSTSTTSATPTPTPTSTPSSTSKTTPAPAATTLDPATWAKVQSGLMVGIQHLDNALAYLSQVNPSSLQLPLLKSSQVAELQKLVAKVPSLQQQLAQAQGWVSVLGPLLGVGKPASYLVELMDRSEMRAGGGFIGNYGIMTLSDGKIMPFNISDTYLLDVPFAERGGQINMPAGYNWWPYPDWGLRDSNLSANFPTSASLGMETLKDEGGPTVEGVIALNPVAIARVLTVTGSVKVPVYNQTVTPQNLEQLIHLYQQTLANDPVTNLPPADQISSSRKNFTALLARQFMATVKSEPLPKLAEIAQQCITSIKTRDIQMYFAGKTAESQLVSSGISSSIASGPGDAVTIVDDNVGANKGSQFTKVTYSDSVSVDSVGTATHHLKITYNFVVTNKSQLFGPDRYLTYLRIYTPTDSHLLSYTGLTNLGGGLQISGASDQPGRHMWGGYIDVPDGVPYVLNFVWTVPHTELIDSQGVLAYQVDYQHQSGFTQQLALTISAAGAKEPAVTVSQPLIEDEVVTVPQTCLQSQTCKPILSSGTS